MKLLFTLLAICFSLVLEAQSASIVGLVQVPRDLFDCSDIKDGDYEHPDKCGSFIICRNQTGFEKDCDPCYDLTECPDGVYHFNAVIQQCDFPNKAGCGTPKPPLTTPPPTTTTTTTTPTTTTTTPPTPPGCPHNCSQQGYCERYQNCNATEEGWIWDKSTQMYWGIWLNETCGENLLWHPFPEAPGGYCDFFENLPGHLQIQYKKDKDCFCPCYWEECETKECRCDGTYYYWNRKNENDHDLVKEVKTCPANLYFNPYTNTCDLCQNVRGGECCIQILP